MSQQILTLSTLLFAPDRKTVNTGHVRSLNTIRTGFRFLTRQRKLAMRYFFSVTKTKHKYDTVSLESMVTRQKITNTVLLVDWADVKIINFCRQVTGVKTIRISNRMRAGSARYQRPIISVVTSA